MLSSSFPDSNLKVRRGSAPDLNIFFENHQHMPAVLKKSCLPRRESVQERVGLLDGHDGYDIKIFGNSDSNTISLYNDGGPLGIHAVPYFNETGKNLGLLIQSIEPDRPVYKDGRIKSGDIVTEINGISLHDVPFQRAQDIFRAAKDTKEIHLKVVHLKFHDVLSGKNGGSQPPPILPKPRSHTPLRPSPLTMPSSIEQNTSSLVTSPKDSLHLISNAVIFNIQDKGSIGNDQNVSTASNVEKSLDTVTKTSTVERSIESNKSYLKKTPPKVPIRSANTLLTGDVPLNAITNTKKIGKKIAINLIKGPTGLGFSVTSRDNQTDGNCPIYIRNILPKGAAVQDGQLRPGDRLLQVNGVEMTGKTQSDAVNFLRLIPEGSEVELVISRQEEVDEKFKVPRKMADNNLLSKNGNSYVDGDKDNSVDDDGEPDLLPLQPVQNEDATDSFNGKKEEIILHIPLNETGSAGLGVSVKGKTVTTESSSKDLGIFVKTVLQGGAAYKDGRLRVNDQLLEVNGVKLEGLSNASAMEALRLAMIQDGNIPGIISLTVARHIGKTSTCDLSPSSTKSYGSSQSKCQSDSEIGTILLTHNKSLSSPEKYMEVFFSSSSNRVQRFSDSGPDSMSESDTTDHDTANKSKHKVNIINTNFKAPLADSKMSTFHNKQRPHSTTSFVHESEKHDPADESNDDIQTSPDDISPKPLLPFEREGMGRQSMSEKRKGHLDPRITEIYKIVKANKEIKEENKEHMIQVNIPSENRVSVYNSPGSTLTVTVNDSYMDKCSSQTVWVDYKRIVHVLTVGSLIYIDDGLISLKVTEKGVDYLKCIVLNGGKLGSKKGCNLPNTPIDLPALSGKDKQDLLFGLDQNVDMIFASFIQLS
ncbi:Partitioning defective 3 [Bulinus truncatus]|nr:Partitioning defective 3 [Bulinus truncatus]